MVGARQSAAPALGHSARGDWNLTCGERRGEDGGGELASWLHPGTGLLLGEKGDGKRHAEGFAWGCPACPLLCHHPKGWGRQSEG